MKTFPALFYLCGALSVACVGTAKAQSRLGPTNAAAASVLLSIEGKVEVARAPSGPWTTAETNQLLYAGDRLRTGPESRAAIRLLDLSVARINELTTLEIRPPTKAGQRMLLDLKSGRSYLFNREKPTELQFRTPLASGAIRGTEFELSVSPADGRTVLTLLEGAVTLGNGTSEIVMASGEQGIVEPNQPPRKTSLLNAINVIQWTLYYPAVVAVDDLRLNLAERQALSESLNAYRNGDILAAISLYPPARQPGSVDEQIYRAALWLSAGQVERAEASLPAAPRGDALRKLMAAVRHETVGATTTPAPATGTEWLAESYYQQSRSQLAAARDAARLATEYGPGNGGSWIRLAEMEAIHGRTRPALAALEEGLRLAPRHAAGMALKGFLLSEENRIELALKFFDAAIGLDGGLAQAWLGRGLCRIRRGDGEGGRADLQVAAALEPTRAVLRSYLGKAFTQTRDEKRAEHELILAKKLDPADPTSWLYSALLMQQQNRINEAIGDLEKSRELNDNRSLFRSEFGLDQDRAVRRANLAGIYRDAGLFHWSVQEAARAVSDDYANYSAHLFLANSYDALRDPKNINLRYETPWFSELLIADLLAPASAGTFPLTTAQEQYARFFERNHLGLVTDTEYLSHGDWIVRGAQYGIVDNTSWAIDGFYQNQRGYRENNALEAYGFSAKVKQQVTSDDTLYLQAQTLDSQSGDLAQYFYQESASPHTQVTERQQPNLFAGWHHEWGPGSHTLFLGGWLNDEFDLSDTFNTIYLLRNPDGSIITGARLPTVTHYETDFEAWSGELQQLWQNEVHSLVAGGRVQSGTAPTTLYTDLTGTPSTLNHELDRYSAYAYYNWQVVAPLKLQAGVSYDYLNYPRNSTVAPFSEGQRHKDQVSPKAGFFYSPLPDTTLRGTFSRSLGGLYYDTSVRLEPTQLGGFNQAFRSIAPESVVGLVPGTEFETYGLAIDQKFPTRTYLTVAGELLYSEGDRDLGAYTSSIAGSSASSVRQTIAYRERALTVTINQLLGNHWAAGGQYRLRTGDLHEHLPDLPPALQQAWEQDNRAALQQVDLFLNFYLRCGFFARWDSLWSHQHNEGYEPSYPSSDFWQHSLSAGYRFFQRRGEIQVGLLNLFDQNYRLNPLTLHNELPRERTLALRLKLYF